MDNLYSVVIEAGNIVVSQDNENAFAIFKSIALDSATSKAKVLAEAIEMPVLYK